MIELRCNYPSCILHLVSCFHLSSLCFVQTKTSKLTINLHSNSPVPTHVYSHTCFKALQVVLMNLYCLLSKTHLYSVLYLRDIQLWQVVTGCCCLHIGYNLFVNLSLQVSPSVFGKKQFSTRCRESSLDFVWRTLQISDSVSSDIS